MIKLQDEEELSLPLKRQRQTSHLAIDRGESRWRNSQKVAKSQEQWKTNTWELRHLLSRWYNHINLNRSQDVSFGYRHVGQWFGNDITYPHAHVSNKRNPGCLGYVRDYTASYIGIIANHYNDCGCYDIFGLFTSLHLIFSTTSIYSLPSTT